jgi:hypothetical protein
MTNNVIKFPKMKLDAPPQNPEELANKISEYKKAFAEDIAEFLWGHVIGELARSGCDFQSNPEELYPSIVLVLEAIKSLHLHANGIEHPLQELAASIIEENDDGIEIVIDIEDDLE